MTTALRRTPLDVRLDDVTGLRELREDCEVDLGRRFPELERWAFGYDGAIVDVWRAVAGFTRARVFSGFRYDGASLPPALLVRLLAGPKERYETAALFHDALYRAQAPRAVADEVFWTIARSGKANVGAFRGWVTWAAVRAFGWRAYRRYDRT